MLKFVVLLALVSSAAAAEINALNTGITKCFTCDRADSNEDCNGAHLDHSTSPHGNGTLHTCLMDNPTCYMRFVTNGDSTGYKVQKGCMDLMECLAAYTWQWDDWNQNSCFFGNPELGANGLTDPADPSTECMYCCTQYQKGYTDGYFDGCNDILPIMQPMPEPNSWNETSDDWPGHERSVRVEPADYVPANFGQTENSAQRPQFGFALFTLAMVLGIGSGLAL